MGESGQTGFGTAKARIGVDSQKQFDQCELCLSRVTGGSGSQWTKSAAPVCCKKGHIFCRECIIENLVNQKKNNDISMKNYLHEQKAVEIREQERQQEVLMEKVTKFEKTQKSLPETGETSKSQRLNELKESEQQHHNTLIDL